MYGFGIMCQQLVKELEEEAAPGDGREEVEFILNLASECLRKDPAARPTAGECLKRLLEYRSRSLQLCSRETANKRRSYWIDAPMDVGTFKRAGKESAEEGATARPRTRPAVRTATTTGRAAMEGWRTATRRTRSPAAERPSGGGWTSSD